MFRHSFVASLVALAAVNLAAQAPAPAPRPAFEVASVKRNTSGEFGAQFGGQRGQVTVRNNTLRNIVRNAYQLQNFQIVDGPSWFDTDRFDITARTAGDTTQQEMILMVRELLADRFKLAVHMETRQLPVYMLIPAREDKRLGPKLTTPTVDCAALIAGAARGTPQPAGPGPICGTRTTPGRVQASSVTMTDFARNLSSFAGRFVIDQTGLMGSWDLDLQWTPDPGMLPTLPPNAPPLPTPDPNGPSLFTAIQEQLGLKLDSQRGPVDVLVIDSAEQPTPD